MATMTSINNELTSDQQFWWYLVEPALSRLLEYTGRYTAEEQESHLRWYATKVTPIFGPRATTENPDPNPFTHDSSPCHISVNWSAKRKPIVRSGMTRPHDVFNSASFVDELQPVIKASHAADQTVFDALGEDLFLKDPEEISKVKAAVPPELHSRIPNIAIAWDLDGAKRKLKLYVNPQAKKLATGRSGNEICISSIRRLDRVGCDFKSAMDLVERYVTELNPEKLDLIIIGMDAAHPSLPKTRIKPYGIVPQANSWEVAKNIYTLGGQVVNEERMRGLEVLGSIWDLLRCHRGERLPDDYHKPCNDMDSTRGVLTPSFEMVPGQAIPDVKMYLSQWQFAKTDREVAECTVEIFKRLGWQKEADSYFDLLREAFPYADLDGPPNLHEFVSFVYTDATGVSLTVYFSPCGRSMRVSGRENGKKVGEKLFEGEYTGWPAHLSEGKGQ